MSKTLEYSSALDKAIEMLKRTQPIDAVEAVVKPHLGDDTGFFIRYVLRYKTEHYCMPMMAHLVQRDFEKALKYHKKSLAEGGIGYPF